MTRKFPYTTVLGVLIQAAFSVGDLLFYISILHLNIVKHLKIWFTALFSSLINDPRYDDAHIFGNDNPQLVSTSVDRLCLHIDSGDSL